MFKNKNTGIWRKILLVGAVILLVMQILGSVLAIPVNASSETPSAATKKTFLPVVLQDHRRQFILLGVYPPGYMGYQDVVDTEVHGLDNWASPGVKISLVAGFALLEDDPSWDIPHRLEMLWSNGYTAFMNLSTTHTCAQIASGAIDNQIRNWANTFKSWADQGGGRFAYLAPLPEMNGKWTVYGRDPANFKLAYARLRQIFNEQGVSAQTTRWVFAPNGWSKKGTPGFESYYPGDASVDIVSFSSYNFGYNPNSASQLWQPPLEVYNNPKYAAPEGWYLDRMRVMAPSKPIFIAQTGTSAYTSSGPSASAKNQWLRDAYAYLASYYGVRGIIYFNLTNSQNIDWPFYVPNDSGHQYQGYRDAVNSPYFRYVSPQELSQTQLTP